MTGRSLTFKKFANCVQFALLNRVTGIVHVGARNHTDVGGVTAALGIQYAYAPRLATPIPVESWTVAGSFGPSAPQSERPIGLFVFGEPGPTDEECLYLNVWAPGGDKKPVIVFIHGGGFTVGSGSAGISHGARLAGAADAVVVTINYRLGSLGWLFHPDLGGGNWGLFDQRAALEWVRDNIREFGGDPARVTVMGQSAGALSILDLLSMPGAEGLFSRAVIQSPPMADAAHEPDFGRSWAEALSSALSGAPAFDPQAIRETAPEAVVAAHEGLLTTEAWRGTRGGALPMRDPASIPCSPAEAPGARPEVDVLIGTTADEGAFFFRAAGRNLDPDDAELLRIVGHLPGIDDPAAEIAAHAGRSNADVLVAIATAAMVERPTDEWAAARAATGARVHRYRVEHRSPQAGFGALHTIDVPLVFGSFADDPIAAAMSGDDDAARAVSAAMQAAIRGFVHDGDPGWPALPAGEAAVFL
jgi:para-nitrobenzyl esterase